MRLDERKGITKTVIYEMYYAFLNLRGLKLLINIKKFAKEA